MANFDNVRDFLGWLIGRRVVDVTQGDPPSSPDSDASDAHYLVLHFDNGGTLDMPIGEEGLSFFNPALVAANRGDLCEDCQAGRPVITANPPELRAKYGRYSTPADRAEQAAAEAAERSKRRGRSDMDLDRLIDTPRHLGTVRSLHYGRRDYNGPDDVVSDAVIQHMLQYPGRWKPENEFYRKNHVNAPGTVRSWFRQMRAADFEREVYPFRHDCGFGGNWHRHSKPWGLMDTQKVIDRETRRYYRPDDYTFSVMLLPLYRPFIDLIGDWERFARKCAVITNVRPPDGF